MFLIKLLTIALIATSASLVAAPAMAQMTESVSTIETKGSISGWEKPLIEQDNNLRHYYWTDISNTKKYRIQSLSPVKNQYRVMPRVASSAKPKVAPAASNKSIARSEASLNGRLRPQAAQYATTATALSYGSYGSGAPASYSSGGSGSAKNVKAKIYTGI